MHLEFSYDKGEVLHALRYHFTQRGEIKVFRNTLIILLLATLTGFFFKVVTPGALTGIVLMVLVLGWVFWYLLPVSIYNKAATFKDSIQLKYSDEGILISTRGSDHQRAISWSNFSQVVETKKFFFLYRDKKTFFLIPTSAFKTEEAYKNFADVLKEKFNHYK
ncbi:YcxB-like protein [Chitinophaga polysaccharea]|uniref:YcxB-like protein n=1 Tax=Chitinophaga polysaccharea TaxID=1293035 RepID=A0A561Q3Z3_9BACT|nr:MULTISPECIES: YcxB family protein [Chitinophaga]NLR61588.1 YcxB family protein [Chitinophaga polysaccharea]NLU93817.1 YcxB family protein [Chitinophaga sp. Ak27]TWF45090.1 YcxB-like protein [Chitinophaga polysaccharea]